MSTPSKQAMERAQKWMSRDYVTKRHGRENPGVTDDLAAEFDTIAREAAQRAATETREATERLVATHQCSCSVMSAAECPLHAIWPNIRALSLDAIVERASRGEG